MNLKLLCKKIGVNFNGDGFEVLRINTILNAQKNEITFLENKKYLKHLSKTRAGAIFIKEEFANLVPKDTVTIISKNPYLDMAKASKYFAKGLLIETKEPKMGKNCKIDKRAVIGNGSIIEDSVTILANAVIGERVKISKGSIIYPNVTIYNDTKIGKNCYIHAGSVIGSDGFGYAHDEKGNHVKIFHNGDVILEDGVEIGANTVIDRAVFGSTIIKSGVKIDNLVQVAHNCEIGQNSIITGQVGLSGSTKLGSNVIMGGQSATSGHLTIGDRAIIAARGGVTKSIKGDQTYSGFPLKIHKDWLKLQAKLSKILKQE